MRITPRNMTKFCVLLAALAILICSVAVFVQHAKAQTVPQTGSFTARGYALNVEQVSEPIIVPPNDKPVLVAPLPATQESDNLVIAKGITSKQIALWFAAFMLGGYAAIEGFKKLAKMVIGARYEITDYNNQLKKQSEALQTNAQAISAINEALVKSPSAPTPDQTAMSAVRATGTGSGLV